MQNALSFTKDEFATEFYLTPVPRSYGYDYIHLKKDGSANTYVIPEVIEIDECYLVPYHDYLALSISEIFGGHTKGFVFILLKDKAVYFPVNAAKLTDDNRLDFIFQNNKQYVKYKKNKAKEFDDEKQNVHIAEALQRLDPVAD